MTDFGGRLREARERKGKSLRQISAATKIPVAALEALERNDISRLPGGIFSRAFVRSYAIEVGLDPERTLSEFLSTFFSVPVETGAPHAASAIGGDAWRGGRAASGAPAAAGGPVVASVARPLPPARVSEEVEFESRQRMAAVVLKLVLASLPVAAAIIYLNSRAVRTPVTVDSMTAAAEAAPPAEAAASPASEALPATAPPTAALPPPETAADEPRAASTTASPPAAPEPEREVPLTGDTAGVIIEMAPTSECWVQLTTDGTVALSRVLQAGEREAHRFKASARLQVGDAEACRFFLNGREARPLGSARQVRTVTITPGNLTSLLR
jgi:cytoskeleton protein RodZ